MKKILLFSALITSTLASAFTSTSVLADFNSALEAYQNEDYQTAHTEFVAMASTGEKRSQFNLGIMYFYGQYVKQDINLAYAWLKLSNQSATLSDAEQRALEVVSAKVTNMDAAERAFKELEAQYSTSVLMDKLYPEIVDISGTDQFNAVPVSIVQPRYPKGAAMNGIQGWVRFSFDVDPLGVPRNIQLVESFPRDVFVKTSRKAIQSWKFKPSLAEKGDSMASTDLRYTLQFRLAGADPIAIKPGVYSKTMKDAIADDASSQFKIGFWEKKLNHSKGKENPNKWFLKAAIQGHSSAQYELGKSLVYGKGCRQDKAKGIEWLTRAASGGQVNAKELLGIVASKVNTLESHRQAVNYFSNIDSLSAAAQRHYAWLLATSPFQDIADPKKSLAIVDDMSNQTFNDDITEYEIQAAAYAAMGKFKKAVDLQEEALEEAQDRKADETTILAHLNDYKANRTWF